MVMVQGPGGLREKEVEEVWGHAVSMDILMNQHTEKDMDTTGIIMVDITAAIIPDMVVSSLQSEVSSAEVLVVAVDMVAVMVEEKGVDSAVEEDGGKEVI